MAEINDLNVTDASNTARFPEDQAASSVNNGARALEGIVARWHKDTNGSLISTGSPNAYVLAANQTLSAYYDGLTLCFEANFTNTGPATLNADAVGAQAIVRIDGSALIGGEIPIGGKALVKYEATNTRWQLLSIHAPSSWQVIERQSASTSAAIDFETLSPTAYEAYRLTLSGVRLDTDNQVLWLRVGTGATPTYQAGVADYGWSGSEVSNGSRVGIADLSDAQIDLAGSVLGIGNATTESLDGQLFFALVDNAAFHQKFRFTGNYLTTDSNPVEVTVGGRYIAATAVTAIRFLSSSGNITEGVFVLEGLRI